jgi:hypothetical protein
MSIDFIIDGSWFCNNVGTVSPVEGARVEFWQQESSIVDWFDQHISNTHTDANGQYSGAFSSHHRHRMYARLVLNDDQGARLHNWWIDSSWCIDTPTGLNTSGLIHNDLVIAQDGGNGTPLCAIWQGARMAVQDYIATIGEAPPGGPYDIDIDYNLFSYPWSTLGTTHWPYGYVTGGAYGPNASYSVNFHEFGHTVRHSLDGNFAHFLYDAVRFWYARTHNPIDCGGTNHGFAFNEGWAEFWATDWGAEPPGAPCEQTTDIEQEGDVAAMLYALSLCSDVGRAGMVSILRENPGSIHSFPDFEAALRGIFPDCGVGALRQGEAVAHNAGEEYAVPAATRIEVTDRLLAKQAQTTDALRRAYGDATRNATTVRPCDSPEQCESLFEMVTAPALLRGRIDQSEQVTAVLKADLRRLQDHGEDEHGAILIERTYRDRLLERKRFDSRTYEIVTDAANAALAAIAPFEDSDRSGTLARKMAIIRASVTDLESRRDRELPPPEAVQPPGADFGQTVTPTT